MNTLKVSWWNLVFDPKKKILLFLIFLMLVFSIFIGNRIPFVINDIYSTYDYKDIFNKNLMYLFGLFFAEYLIKFFYQFLLNFYVTHILKKLRHDAYKNFIYSIENKQMHKTRDRYSLGEVISRLINDSDAIMELIGSGSFAIFIDVVFIISCLIGFLTINIKVGLALIIVELAFCLILYFFSKSMKDIFNKVRIITGQMSRVLADVLKNLKSNYFFKENPYSFKKSFNVFEDFLNLQLKANIWDAFYYSLAESLFPLILVIMVLLIPVVGLKELATIAVIIDLIQKSINPIKDVASKISNIQRAKTGLDRIEAFHNDLNLLDKTSTKSLNSDFNRFNNFDFYFSLNEFSYGSNSFRLTDISFSLPFGTSIGIIGASGCGKSTLLKILAGNIFAKNAIFQFINEDTKVKQLDLNIQNSSDLLLMRDRVSLVTQDSYLFTDTLQFNITLGKNDHLFEEFWNKIIKNLNYIKNWGILKDTILDIDNISLGQKQLICALRACFLSKEIILFDEISSSLDSELEDDLSKIIKASQVGRATIVVSHRIETIIKLDKILFLEKGKISSIGPHEELMKTNKSYQEFISHLNV